MDGRHIVVCVELAAAIGFNEAMMLQQIHYWCRVSANNDSNFHDGHYWVHKTSAEWAAELLWKSPTTAKETIKELRKRELIITGKYSRGNKNRTISYRVNYDKLAELTSSFQSSKMIQPPENIFDHRTKISYRSDKFCPNDRTESVQTTIYKKLHLENTQENGDFPLTENPTTVKSLVRNDLNIDLQGFIDWYYFEYARTFGKNHPALTADQRNGIISALSEFLRNPDYSCVNDAGLRDMARMFFNSVPSKDWHIFHFVEHNILKHRFQEVYRH